MGIAIMADAAAFEIEAHCELALLAQTITLVLHESPIGPLWAAGVSAHPVSVQAMAEDGSATNLTAFYVVAGRHLILELTETVSAHALRISYPAGYGQDVGSIPADRQLAINDHAAMMYDARATGEAPQGLSVAAARSAARHRRVALCRRLRPRRSGGPHLVPMPRF